MSMRLIVEKTSIPAFLKTSTLLATSALVGSGCTTSVTSQRLSDFENQPSGVIYSLPMLQYDFDVTWKVIKCGPNPKIKVTAKVKELNSVDHDAAYVLDYTSLSSPTKVTALTVKLEEQGLIKSINAVAEDRTGEVIKNLFSIAGDVALTAAGVPPVPAAPAAPAAPVAQIELCTADIKRAVDSLQQSENDLERRTEALNTANTNVKNLMLLIEAQPKPGEPWLQKLEQALKASRQAAGALTGLQRQRARQLASVSFSATEVWPASGSWPKAPKAVMTHTIELPGQVRHKWFIGTPADLQKQLKLYLQLQSKSSSFASAVTDASNAGVYYRHPVPVRLTACLEDPCSQPTAKQVKQVVSQAPQAGPLVLLPFSNGPFQNNSLEVEFASGQPSEVIYKELSASAETATAAGAEIAKQLPSLQQQLLKADLEKLKRETALLEQKQALQTAGKALLPGPTADIEAQKAMVEAETNLVKAKLALKQAQAELAGN